MPDRREWRPGLRRRPTAAHLDATAGVLRASGANTSGDDPAKEGVYRSGLIRQAQQRVWDYRSQVGELAHAIEFYENCFSRIRLTVAVEEDDGTRTPAFNEDGSEAVKGASEALAAVRALRSPVGGQSQLMRAIGGCLASVGEGHLVGVDDLRMKGGQSYEFLSPSEFFEPAANSVAASASNGKGTTHTYHRLRYPGAPPEVITGSEAMVVRIWQPDRQFSSLPWAAPLGMQDILEELVLLTREVAGAVKSRLAVGGILLVADDIEYQEDDDADPNQDDAADPFTADLIRYASVAIKQKDNPAGVLPLVVRVPADRVGEAGADGKQGFRLLTFNREWDAEAAKKRAECVLRFAQGYDLPVEVILGHMSTTFANAAQISADMYRLYVEPKVLIGTDGLTTGYLRAVIPGTPFVVHPDPTDLVVKPDQIGDWERAFDRFAVSFSSYRAKLGASEADAPDAAEVAMRLLLKSAGAAQAVGVGDTGASPDASSPTPIEPDETSIAAAIDVTTRQVLQRAGARLRSKAQAQRGLASLISNVPDSEVAATLGRQTVATLLTEAELFGREFEALWAWAFDRSDRAVADEVRDQAREEASRRLYAPAAVGR